jgi:hypothetical protein
LNGCTRHGKVEKKSDVGNIQSQGDEVCIKRRIGELQGRLDWSKDVPRRGLNYTKRAVDQKNPLPRLRAIPLTKSYHKATRSMRIEFLKNTLLTHSYRRASYDSIFSVISNG